MAGTSLAKERRDLRQQEAQEKAAEEGAKVDLNAQWQDPMMGPDRGNLRVIFEIHRHRKPPKLCQSGRK